MFSNSFSFRSITTGQPGCLSIAQDSLENFCENKAEIQRDGTADNQDSGPMLGLSKIQDDCIKIGEIGGFSTIAHGNVIALHCEAHNRFIRLKTGGIDAHGDKRDVDTLPVNWGSEQFIVVHRGGGDYSFYGISDGSFLRMKGDIVIPSAYKTFSDKVEALEVFQVRERGRLAMCALLHILKTFRSYG